MSTSVNYSLTLRLHVADKPPEQLLRKSGPFLQKRCSELWNCCLLDRASRNRSLKHVTGILDWFLVGGASWPVHSLDGSIFQELVCVVSSVWARIIVHENTIRTDRTCIRSNINIQDLVNITYSRQCAVFNDVKVRFPVHADSGPYHD